MIGTWGGGRRNWAEAEKARTSASSTTVLVARKETESIREDMITGSVAARSARLVSIALGQTMAAMAVTTSVTLLLLVLVLLRWEGG